jgi:hypothetical protein
MGFCKVKTYGEPQNIPPAGQVLEDLTQTVFIPSYLENRAIL